MIRSALIVHPASVRVALSTVAALSMAVIGALPAAADAAGPQGSKMGLQGDSMAPSGPSDHFVEGKYDKNGTYIPPHYQPVSKPPFHGYFFKKKPGDKNELGPMGINAKSD